MTNDKTVEAVARALEPEWWRVIDEDIANGFSLGQNHIDMKERTLSYARHAIEAHTECLMEPSEEMILAGFMVQRLAHKHTSEEWLRRIFQAMLSAQEKT